MFLRYQMRALPFFPLSDRLRDHSTACFAARLRHGSKARDRDVFEGRKCGDRWPAQLQSAAIAFVYGLARSQWRIERHPYSLRCGRVHSKIEEAARSKRDELQGVDQTARMPCG